MKKVSGAPPEGGQALLTPFPEPVPVSALTGDDPSRVGHGLIEHNGIELLAHGGRLVHARKTRSFRELW